MEVFEEWGESRSVSFEHNNLKRVTTRQFRGVGLRLIREGRIGFASTTDLRDPRRLVELALESAGFGEEARFEFPSHPAEVAEVETMDPAVEQVTFDEMVATGREGLEMSRSANDDYLYDASISRQVSGQRIINSSGLDLTHVSSQMAASVSVEHVSDDGLLEVYEYTSWRRPVTSVAQLTRTVLEKMERAATLAPVSTQIMPVVFVPKAMGTLLGPILLAASGKLVHKGSSVLRDRIGEQVLGEALTIADDGSIPFAPASGAVDCEGIPVRRVPIIENGVLRNYYVDLQTAGLLGTEPTGHGYRSYASQPSPGGSNTVVSPGETSLEEMLDGTTRGVVVEQTLGSGQSNLLAGEFSVNVELGFLVEDGEIRGRVKDCMVSGNSYEALNHIEAVGKEQQWVGSELVPPVCVGGLKLSAAQ